MSRLTLTMTLAIFLAACSKDENKADAMADTAGLADTAGPADHVGQTDPGKDPISPGDTAVSDPSPPPDCGQVGTTPMGYGCENDCDCVPGLVCYDEAYPGAKKVCTRDCQGGCGEGFICILFSSTHWNKYKDMTLKNLCVPACTGLGDCNKYGGIYTWCTGNTASYWEGQTLALKGHCQVTKTE